MDGREKAADITFHEKRIGLHMPLDFNSCGQAGFPRDIAAGRGVDFSPEQRRNLAEEPLLDVNILLRVDGDKALLAVLVKLCVPKLNAVLLHVASLPYPYISPSNGYMA